MIQSQHQAANVYTDINALQGIRQLGKEDKDAALMEVAKQFESMFLNMMLSSMRQANQVFKEDSLFSSSESDFYQKMYDDQIALSLSSSQGTGLAKVIHRQMLSNYGMQQDKPELNHEQLRRHDSSLNKAIEQVGDILKNTASETGEDRAAAIAETPAVQAVTTPPSATNIPSSANSVAVQPEVVAASGEGAKGQQFATPQAFVAALYPHAQKIGQQLKVDPKAIVAQAALETGWGKHMISDQQGTNSFNFFGIKADSRWQGDKVEIMTHEYRGGVRMNEKAQFRSYASLQDGLADYARFLSDNKRYENAVGQDLTGKHYGHELQKAGYATDPAYGQKINRISSGAVMTNALKQMQAGERNDG
ncbi:flagellar assembly peptidoglycan hydrolase FlgJ [Bacterioplanoides sp.]|uniref:flagellar assembly peptidoglycan hydrolase FlgJ n=1 Tax=Bacterioplanoides sp. TaxID=2066072 RepID=UPI003B5A17BE